LVGGLRECGSCGSSDRKPIVLLFFLHWPTLILRSEIFVVGNWSIWHGLGFDVWQIEKVLDGTSVLILIGTGILNGLLSSEVSEERVDVDRRGRSCWRSSRPKWTRTRPEWLLSELGHGWCNRRLLLWHVSR
jgi:hypothetical protein